VLAELARNVVLAPQGDVAATRQIFQGGDVAAVIIEPTGASWGQVPVSPDFLHALRELSSEHGVVLIFDEVISGFRVSPGGAQGYYKIMPDLTTLAKIVAGGMPGGAIVGRKAILDALDFVVPEAAHREKVPHQGTFNANPVSAAAGITTLGIIADGDACQRAIDYAAELREQLARAVHDEGTDWAVYGTFSGFHIFTNPEHLPISAEDIAQCKYDYRVLKSAPRSLVTKLRLGMLVHGVEIFGWPGGPTSAVHTQDDLEWTVEAFRRTLRRLRDAGEISK
jgi:glutamate-1-semialdehyde 2,1-aminomutase